MKNYIRLFTFLGLSALLFTSCANKEEKAIEKEVVETESVDMEKVRQEIQAMENAYAAAEKAKDADAVAAYYSDDAVGYSRNKKPLVGKEAIKENISRNLANDTLGHYNVYKIVDLYAAGDIAVEVGSWTEFDSTGTKLNDGNYMSYFEKRDGKYVCVRDMSTITTPVKSEM